MSCTTIVIVFSIPFKIRSQIHAKCFSVIFLKIKNTN